MGTSREVAEAAVQRGDPDSAVFEPVLLQVRLERTLSAATVESQGGPPRLRAARSWRALASRGAVINVAGDGFNQLNGPYDAKVVGDYTGLRPPFDEEDSD